MKSAVVWRFFDAPEHLRALSTNGGDEDWLVTLPKAWRQDYLPWLDVMDSCGSPNWYAHPTDPSLVVVIGSHA